MYTRHKTVCIPGWSQSLLFVCELNHLQHKSEKPKTNLTLRLLICTDRGIRLELEYQLTKHKTMYVKHAPTFSHAGRELFMSLINNMTQ